MSADGPPRRWRRLVWRVHALLGLVAGAGLLVVGASGSAVVFDRALEHAVHPSLVRAADPGPALPLDRLRAAVRRQAPDVRLTAWYLPREAGDVHRVLGQAGVHRVQLTVEPATGRLRDRRRDIGTLVPWLVYLHWGFTAGQWGALLTGVLALALVASSVTGLVVHRRGWAAFRPVRHAGPGAARRRAADWHARTGLVSLVALVLLGATGFWMNRSAFHLLWGGRSEIRTLATGPDHAEAVSLDGLLATAMTRIPGFTPRVIGFPKHPGRDLVVRGGVPSFNPLWHDRASVLAVDPATGQVRTVRDIRTAGPGAQLEAAVGPLHFGRWGGPVVGVLYVVAGLAPGLLALTGAFIWWRRTRRRPAVTSAPAVVATPVPSVLPRTRRERSLRLPLLLLLPHLPAATLEAQALFAPPAEPMRLRAVRTPAPLRLDGRLDEAAWQTAPVARGFVQAEPRQGAPASAHTEVRVLFDATHLYIGAFCADSGAAVRVRDLRRDFDDTTDDFFGVAIDGVGERRSAAVFRVNARGALRDQQSVDGGLSDVDFDAVWSARTSRSDSGWIAELAIPWQSLRYRAGTATMGINFQRLIRHRNENTGWAPWPRALEPYRMDYAGVLEGLEPPPPSRNLRVLPYVLAEARRGAAVGPDTDGDAGLDLKWAVSPNAVLDLTTNPDFGQADVDRQVVNLTRFSVFFPERRQFFLENRGLFFTGNGSRFEPFFSRRIGIDDAGNPLTIRGGARFSVRTRAGAAGALAAVQEGTDSLPGAAFAVLRAVRNLGRQDRLGVLLSTRHDADGRTNAVGGVDWFVRPTPGSFVRGTLTASTTTGGAASADGEGLGGFLWIANTANWGYVGYISELVTRRYEARTGFVLRNDYVRISPAVTLDWRPAWRPRWLRRWQPGVTLEHFVAASTGAVQEGFLSLRPVAGQFEHGGRFEYALLPNWQRLGGPFRPLPGLAVAPGAYDYLRHRVQLSSDPSARVAASLDASTGGYFDGRLHSVRTVVQATPDPHLALSADYTLNLVRDLGPARTDLTTHLLGVESRFAASPRLQLVSFAQWNTAARQLTLNARLAWEYRPLAFVYLIYNDRSAVAGLGGPETAPATARQLLLKVTWLSQL